MKMIGNWEIAHFDEPASFILYAEAYLQASRLVCLRMQEDNSDNTWPNAAVAMMLAAHSVELFLKGAIFSRDQNALTKTHSIDQLAKTYFRLLPEAEFSFDIPFQWEYPSLQGDCIYSS